MNGFLILTNSAQEIQALQNKIRIFGTVQMVCGVLAIACLVLTGLLFWRLKIWRTLLERTGIASKKRIAQLQQENEKTGRINKNSAAQVAAQEFTGQLTGERKKERRGKRTGEMKSSAASGRIGNTGGKKAEYVPQVAPQYADRFVLTQNQWVVHTDEQIQGGKSE